MADQPIPQSETLTHKFALALAVRLQDYRAWRQRRRDLNELRALGAAGLRDLGIEMSECRSIVETGGRDRRRGYEN